MKVLQFSGGKDSLAVLYLSRPDLKDIDVHFGNAAALPSVVEYVQRVCDRLGARLKIIRPEQAIEVFQAEHGLPSDLLPVWNTKQTAWTGSGVKLQSSASCCSAMLWGPMYRAVLNSGSRTVLRGAKACDEQRGVPPGFTDENGISYFSPIWNWSDEDVFSYLKREGAEIPEHYGEVDSSLDCWLCTGHTHSSHANDQFKYIRNHHPELWPSLQQRLARVKGAVKSETAAFDAAIDGVI